jgi:hypothetical protein
MEVVQSDVGAHPHISFSVGRCTPAFDGASGAFATSIRTGGVYDASSMPVDFVGTAKGARAGGKTPCNGLMSSGMTC